MSRRLAGVLTGLLLLGAAGRVAAHGGAYRPPGGAPPPMSGPSPTPTSVTPGDGWQTWWDLNRVGLLPGRDEAARRRVVSTEREPDPDAEAAAWAARRVAASRTSVVPFLLGVVDPHRERMDELRGASLIALAKVAQDRVHVPVLVHWLLDRKAKPLVRESAAFAIGLLRRTRPDLQLGGGQLDRLRDHLLAVFDEKDAPDQVRAFAAIAIGLLGDQPFGSEETKDGRAVTAALWERLRPTYATADLPAALLAAMALQPRAGCPPEVQAGLESVVLRRAALGRTWEDRERSHAFMAALRLGSPTVQGSLLRLLSRRREGAEVRRAACLALGRRAAEMPAADRVLATRVVLDALEERGDPLLTGLELLALGRLVAADLRAGSASATTAPGATAVLLRDAASGSTSERGFATLGIALAGRAARASEDPLVRPFSVDARRVVLGALATARGDAAQRAAGVVAAGLLGMEEAVGTLSAVVDDRGEDPALRGHAAVALGQIGRGGDPVRERLLGLLGEERGTGLRVQAALALSLFGGGLLRTRLVQELSGAATEYHRCHVLVALGYLGDVGAVPDLLSYAADESRSDLSRALAVAALGILTDPEVRPSVLRLTEDANYPSATPSLLAAWTIY